MKKILLELFEECLRIPYRNAENAASYAYYRKQDSQGTALYIFFEKSNGRDDWIQNLHFAAHPYNEMERPWKCHTGFLKVWKSVLPLLRPHILDPSVTRAVITGYSHGAAIAALCHEYVYYHRPDLRPTLLGVGFGCPRVFYGCPTSALSERWEHFFVVRNGDDLVTHLPPRFSSFCHVGNLITLTPPSPLSPIDAHRPESYLESLGAL